MRAEVGKVDGVAHRFDLITSSLRAAGLPSAAGSSWSGRSRRKSGGRPGQTSGRFRTGRRALVGGVRTAAPAPHGGQTRPADASGAGKQQSVRQAGNVIGKARPVGVLPGQQVSCAPLPPAAQPPPPARRRTCASGWSARISTMRVSAAARARVGGAHALVKSGGFFVQSGPAGVCRAMRARAPLRWGRRTAG